MSTSSSSRSAQKIVSIWLSGYANTLRSRDYVAAANTFLLDGWLRDILLFIWDLRALEGREKIAAYLAASISFTKNTDIALDRRLHLEPRCNTFSPKHAPGVEGAFTFQTLFGAGGGYFHLLDAVGTTYVKLTRNSSGMR